MSLRAAHVDHEDDGWITSTWMRARLRRRLTVDLMSGRDIFTQHSEPPVVVIGDPNGGIEVRDRRELDGLIRALTDARRVWDALNP